MSVNFLEPRYPYTNTYRKKMIMVIFLSLTLSSMLVGGVVWAGSQLFKSEEALNIADTPSTKLEPIDTHSFIGKIKSFFEEKTSALTGSHSDRINVALFGIGGEGHDGAQLTDTILLASIQPSTKKISLISIPRDTLVTIPEMGARKINEANALAEAARPGSGGEVATKTLEQFLGVTIPYYVRVDFNGFKKIIDDVDGVDVYVDKNFSDSQFPTTDFKYRTITFEKGWQHMDGATALDYARSRHGTNFEGSDFARAHRQQKLLLALRDRILSGDTLLHPSRISTMLTTLDTHIQTNIRFNDTISFMQLAKDLRTDEIINVVFSDDPASVLIPSDTPGGFYLRPKDPTLEQIHHVAQDIFNPETSKSIQGIIDQTPLEPQKIKEARIELQNGTWRPGFASRQKKKLSDAGYLVKRVGNAQTRPTERAQIFLVNKKSQTIFDELKKRYGAEELIVRPPASPDTTDEAVSKVDIIVILGENVSDLAE